MPKVTWGDGDKLGRNLRLNENCQDKEDAFIEHLFCAELLALF